jgi:hypothetical protein
MVGLEWTDDSESNAGGDVATATISLVGQVKVMTENKRNIPVLQVGGLGVRVRLTTSPHNTN